MKQQLAIALAALGTLAAGAATAAPKDPSGTWLTEDGRARVRIERCGPAQAQICGYVVWLKVPLTDKGEPRVDFKNPDARKRTRPSLGLQLALGLKPNKDDKYAGQLYNAEDGKLYDVTLELESPDELSIGGCVFGILCGSQGWTRVKDVAPGQLTAATGAPGGPTPDAEWAVKPVPASTTGEPARRAPAPAARP